VKDHRIFKTPPLPVEEKKYYPDYHEPRIFKFDMATMQRQELNFDEASQLYLSGEYKSPDNFEVTPGNNSSGFFPFYYESRTSNALYVRGHGYSKKLFEYSYANYWDTPRFFSWIIK
jgi:hypothetical protein